jgi:hypothetical protein
VVSGLTADWTVGANARMIDWIAEGSVSIAGWTAVEAARPGGRVTDF